MEKAMEFSGMKKGEEIGFWGQWINHHDAVSAKRMAKHDHPISHASSPPLKVMLSYLKID